MAPCLGAGFCKPGYGFDVAAVTLVCFMLLEYDFMKTTCFGR